MTASTTSKASSAISTKPPANSSSTRSRDRSSAPRSKASFISTLARRNLASRWASPRRRGGTRLALGSVALADGRLQATTTAGLKLSLPLDEVARFDFSAGKIAFLSDLTPESFKYVPYFGFKDQPAAVSEFYAFRRDSGFDQQPLKLDGKTYAKGLALASRSTLVYRLPGKFRLLKTVIGIDDSAGEGGDVHVEFHGDGGKLLWQGDVRAADAPRELEIDVAGVKRLEIVVDYGGDLDIGDWLDLAEARVTK